MDKHLGSGRHHFRSRAGAFLIVIALVTSLVGCIEAAPLEYQLTISATEGGSVTSPGPGSHTYEQGTVVSLVALPDDFYEFAEWTGDTGGIADPASSTTTITVNGDYTITASFAIIRYDLTVSSTAGGWVTAPGEGVFTYDAGTDVSLVATADKGHYFVGWSGDVGTVDDVNSPSAAIAMRDSYSVTANFEELPPGRFALTVLSTAGGSVTSPGRGVFTFDAGTVVSLAAVAYDCYEFAGWTGDTGRIGDPTSPATTITVDDDYTITATFVIIRYGLTVDSTGGGSVTAPGEGTFTCDCGATVELVAMPDDFHKFTGWTGDTAGIADPTSSTTTITVTGDSTIRAGFAIIRYDLTVGSTGGGSVTSPGNGIFTYDVGTVVSLVAASGDCHEFTGWTGDTGSVAIPASPTTTITMEGNYSVTATFAPLSYQLTVSSTGFGSVAGPGEGTFAYDCGTLVDLVASPAARCRFVGWAGDVEAIGDVNAPRTTLRVDRNLTITARFELVPMVAAGILHTVGLKSDGTAVATGGNAHGQCDVGGWTNVVQVAAGEHHTIGLRADGTVIAAGGNPEGQADVRGWKDIVQVACGRYHTVGVRSDGTVVATGRNNTGQCNVGGWTGIVQVAAGVNHTLGLRADGTVVAVGSPADGRLEVGGWTNIVQVAAGDHHSLGLRSDGTVLAVGQNLYGETNLSSWASIVQVAGAYLASVGLKSDGTVVHSGGQCVVGSWTGIVHVDVGLSHTVGLRSNGTVVAGGGNCCGQCNVGSWMLG